EIETLLANHRVEIETGKLRVFLIDECHLMWGESYIVFRNIRTSADKAIASHVCRAVLGQRRAIAVWQLFL
ncbi:hypothetical protein, partial [Nostoc sp.]|uniref:hypothetical protein n=1 Tax=Nostoc sp. TaxID=1180 RepID=UPI002FF675CE